MNGKFVIVGIIIVFVGLTISLAIMQQIEIQKQNESSNIVNTEQIKSAKEIPLEKETTRIKSQQNELSSIRNSEQIIPKKKMVEVKSKQPERLSPMLNPTIKCPTYGKIWTGLVSAEKVPSPKFHKLIPFPPTEVLLK